MVLPQHQTVFDRFFLRAMNGAAWPFGKLFLEIEERQGAARLIVRGRGGRWSFIRVFDFGFPL